jgi:ribosomal protein L21E
MLVRVVLVTLLALYASGCAAPASQTVELTPQNDSGVAGTAILTDLGAGRTRVEITVEPAGNPDMPAHVHAGTCGDLIPQPRYALVNVVDGRSTTEIAASLDELLGSEVAINLHQSNDAMEVSTACAELPAGD